MLIPTSRDTIHDGYFLCLKRANRQLGDGVSDVGKAPARKRRAKSLKLLRYLETSNLKAIAERRLDDWGANHALHAVILFGFNANNRHPLADAIAGDTGEKLLAAPLAECAQQGSAL